MDHDSSRTYCNGPPMNDRIKSMGLFKSKPKKRNAQADTGYRHGLAFIDDKTRWVIPDDGMRGILVTGSKADEVGSRVVKALSSDGDDCVTIDFMGEGLSSMNASSETAIDLPEANALLAKLKNEALSIMQVRASEESNGNGLLDKFRGTQSEYHPSAPLLVINGLEPRGEQWDDADAPAHDDVLGEPERPNLDASIEAIGVSREALGEMVEPEVASNIELSIKASMIDTMPAVLVRWSIVLRLTGEPSSDGDNSVKLPVPEDPVIVDGIEMLRRHEGESFMAWAQRASTDDLTAQSALALTQCDSRIGLPWDADGSPDERAEGIRVLKRAVDSQRSHNERRMTPLQRLWSDVATLMRLSDSTGMRTVVIAREPELDALAEVMPSIGARVIAGTLPDGDAWVAGTMNEPDITEYGTGDLQVVSTAKIGRFKSSTGTLRSPFMRTDMTTIDLV